MSFLQHRDVSRDAGALMEALDGAAAGEIVTVAGIRTVTESHPGTDGGSAATTGAVEAE